jgi:hypothetical protein
MDQNKNKNQPNVMDYRNCNVHNTTTMSFNEL